MKSAPDMSKKCRRQLNYFFNYNVKSIVSAIISRDVTDFHYFPHRGTTPTSQEKKFTGLVGRRVWARGELFKLKKIIIAFGGCSRVSSVIKVDRISLSGLGSCSNGYGQKLRLPNGRGKNLQCPARRPDCSASTWCPCPAQNRRLRTIKLSDSPSPTVLVYELYLLILASLLMSAVRGWSGGGRRREKQEDGEELK